MIRLLFNFAKEPLLLFLQILLDRSLFHDLLSQKSDRLLRAAVDAPVAHRAFALRHRQFSIYMNILERTEFLTEPASDAAICIDFKLRRVFLRHMSEVEPLSEKTRHPVKEP